VGRGNEAPSLQCSARSLKNGASRSVSVAASTHGERPGVARLLRQSRRRHRAWLPRPPTVETNPGNLMALFSTAIATPRVQRAPRVARHRRCAQHGGQIPVNTNSIRSGQQLLRRGQVGVSRCSKRGPCSSELKKNQALRPEAGLAGNFAGFIPRRRIAFWTERNSWDRTSSTTFSSLRQAPASMKGNSKTDTFVFRKADDFAGEREPRLERFGGEKLPT